MNPTQPMARYAYLDGIRGFAAVYVMLTHGYYEFNWKGDGGNLPSWIIRACSWLQMGHWAVAIFIVLSGYCLMLPVAASPDSKLPGGFFTYFFKRWKRICPPYLICFALTLLLIQISPSLQTKQGVRWDGSLPVWDKQILLSHLFLVHNLHPNWMYKINPPFWSIAVEFQIYFLFPMFVLLWKRFRFLGLLGAGFLLGWMPHFLLPKTWNLDWTFPWYIGLFSLGAASACITQSWKKQNPIGLTWNWKLYAAIGTLFLFLVSVFGGGWWYLPLWLSDPIIGMITSCLCIACTQIQLGNYQETPGLWMSFIYRLCSNKTWVFLGSFSYSLYLVHYPLLSWFHAGLRCIFLSQSLQLLILLTGGSILCILVAYLFHVAAEKPFMHSQKQTSKASTF